MRNIMICTLKEYYYRDKIEHNKQGRACGMHGRQTEMDIEFWWVNLQERDYQQDLGTDGRNNIKIDLK
jgi:hypothetical protein